MYLLRNDSSSSKQGSKAEAKLSQNWVCTWQRSQNEDRKQAKTPLPSAVLRPRRQVRSGLAAVQAGLHPGAFTETGIKQKMTSGDPFQTVKVQSSKTTGS